MTAFCPNCKKVVPFDQHGTRSRCPECGATYGVAQSGDGEGPFMSVIKVIAWVMIIMMAIVGITAAVVFVGCVAAMTKL